MATIYKRKTGQNSNDIAEILNAGAKYKLGMDNTAETQAIYS